MRELYKSPIDAFDMTIKTSDEMPARQKARPLNPKSNLLFPSCISHDLVPGKYHGKRHSGLTEEFTSVCLLICSICDMREIYYYTQKAGFKCESQVSRRGNYYYNVMLMLMRV